MNSLEFTSDFKNNLIGKVQARGISRERIPSPEELTRILYYLPPQGRAVVQILATSGMRVGEVLQLKIDDLAFDYVANIFENKIIKKIPIARINIRAETTKTNEARHTYISPNARTEVERWLSRREGYIQKLKALRIKPNEALVFPFSYHAFGEIWQAGLKKAGLFEKDPNTNRLVMRIHTIRKFFRSWKWSNRDVPEALMGHQSGMNAIYARFDSVQAEGMLIEGYQEAVDYLTIGDIGEKIVVKESSEDMKFLKDWNRQLRYQVDEAKDDRKLMKKELDTMSSKMEKQEHLLQMVLVQMGLGEKDTPKGAWITDKKTGKITFKFGEWIKGEDGNEIFNPTE